MKYECVLIPVCHPGRRGVGVFVIHFLPSIPCPFVASFALAHKPIDACLVPSQFAHVLIPLTPPSAGMYPSPLPSAPRSNGRICMCVFVRLYVCTFEK